MASRIPPRPGPIGRAMLVAALVCFAVTLAGLATGGVGEALAAPHSAESYQKSLAHLAAKWPDRYRARAS